MIAEAIDTIVTLGWALLAWIVLTAAVTVLAGYAVVAIVWTTVRGVWRGATAALSIVQHSRTPEPPRDAPDAPEAHSRPAPSWARTDEEAA